MADQSITQLPIAFNLTGNEQTVVVQGGVTKQASVSQIANAASPGKLITNVSYNPENGDLTFYYSDGSNATVGPVSGSSGATGSSGYSGFSGYSGKSGYSGYSGSGLSGYSGIGVSGYSGFSGYSGAGVSGYSGYSGAGVSGYSGKSGYSGYSGSGVSGYSGYSGAGVSGYSGYSGAGVSGYSGYSGSGVSGYSGSGVSGYSGYSGAGLSGYSGYSGAGVSGYSGYSGSGVSGYSGSGVSGYSGYSGVGVSGYSGYSGAGVSGYSGYSGSGVSGYSGSGVSGYSGYSGAGVSGYSGYSGAGVSGYSGYSGSGVSGYSGSGVSGYSGYSGSGVSGYSGYSGSGVSGYSGSGVSGYSGTSGYSGSSIAIGGTSTQLQYNNSGALGGVANITYNGSTTTQTSGTIDGTTIGGTTPAAGTFTTLIGGGGSANYIQATGGATTKAVQFQTLGSDAAVSLAIQPKGTGAIDLAAGSSGVNISNGGTVTALTRTAGGAGYTSYPSVAISAPTTAGGVQATATCTVMFNAAATIASGGTGYTVGDVLTMVGGTPTSTGGTFTVTTVSSGAVTGVTANSKAYTALPSNPVSTTVSPAGGTGCTLNVTYSIDPGGLTIGTAGSGYVEQPTVTISGGGGSGGTGYATVGSVPKITSLGGDLSFYTPGGEAFRVADIGGTTVNYVSVRGDTSTGNTPKIIAAGASGTLNLAISSKSSGAIIFYTNSSTNTQMQVTHTASSVNYVQVTGAATNSGPEISSQGSDTSVSINYTAKNAGNHIFKQAGGTNFRVNYSVTAPINYLAVTGSLTGSSPSLYSQGSDTDIDLTLTPKGAGTVKTSGTGIRLVGASSGYVGLKGAAAAGSTTYQLPAADGTSGQVLSTNGSAVLSWATASGGGGGTPGGSSGQLQYNNSSSFGGVTNVTVTTGQTTARIDPRVSVESNSATSVTPDISLYDMYVWTGLSTAGTLTINIPSGTPLNGDKLMFRIQDDGTSGAVTLSWVQSGTGCFRTINVPLPTTTGGAAKVVYVGCIYNSFSATWDVIASGTQF